MGRIILAILLLVSPALAGKWDKPDKDKNRRVHQNRSHQFRIEVDDTTMALAMWDNLDMPAWMSFRTFAIRPGNFRMDGDTIVISRAGVTARFYMADPQTLEWETVLASRPPVNSVSFPINTENLEYYFQSGGSYSVYHTSRSWNNYRTGKAFDISRPIVIDANDDSTFADLTISDGNLTISVDGNWLDNAAYPITIDPTFGLKAIGATSGAMATWATTYVTRSHRYISNQYTAGSNDVFTEMWVYADSTTDGPSELAGALYGIDNPSGDSAIPDNRLALTDTLAAVPNGYSWLRLNAVSDYSLTENDTVTLAWEVSQNVNSYYDAGTRACAMYETDSNPLPSDITPPATQNNIWSVFGCINQEGGGGTFGHSPSDYNLGTNWTNPDDGRIYDANCATYDNNGQDKLCFHGFDFSIPTDATIDSFTIVYTGLGGALQAAKRDYYVGLTKDSTNVYGTAKLDTLDNGTCGGGTVTFSGDLFGGAEWLAADVNHRGFGVIFYDADGQSDPLYFNAIWVTVYFTPAVAGGVTPSPRRKVINKVFGG